MKHITRAALAAAVCSFGFLFAAPALADTPQISSFTLNSAAANATFRPDLGESVTIGIGTDGPVYFSRLYICPSVDTCTADYTRYFTVYATATDAEKTWDGKTSSNASSPIAPAGEYHVVLSAKDADGNSFSLPAPYSIFLASGGSGGGNQDNPATSTATSTDAGASATSTATTTVITKIVYVSSHQNPAALSNWQDSQPFSVSAGRDRLATVGASVAFAAKFSASANISYYQPSFAWSFGDGTQAAGQNVSHIYKYPGDYPVILNGTMNGIAAVSRATVHVAAPAVSLAVLPAGIRLSNADTAEINLGGWRFSQGSSSFGVPADTIVLASSSVVFAHADTGLSASGSVALLDPSGGIVASTSLPLPPSVAAQSVAASSAAHVSLVLKKSPAVAVQPAASSSAAANPFAETAAAAVSGRGFFGAIARFFGF
ncbi:MAG: PKD domain-containing protein [Patescibacteria group bacterium]|nr:PKD domain-containing protein [Patescibacteria group bacterium]MDE1945822.1 PKD domain-containing protein [Patescibacteria group bacterium]